MAQTLAALQPVLHSAAPSHCAKRKEWGTRRTLSNAIGRSRVWYHHAGRDINEECRESQKSAQPPSLAKPSRTRSKGSRKTENPLTSRSETAPSETNCFERTNTVLRTSSAKEISACMWREIQHHTSKLPAATYRARVGPNRTVVTVAVSLPASVIVAPQE